MLSIFMIRATTNTFATRTSSQPAFGLNARMTALERDQLGRKRQGRLKLMQSLSRQLYLKLL